MAYERKTWQEKLADDKGLPKVAKIEGNLSKRALSSFRRR
jgi:hypothetical protein